MMKRTPRAIRAGLVAVLLGGTALGGLGTYAVTANAQDSASANGGAIQPTGPSTRLPDFSHLAAQVSPAVVSVTVREKPEQGPAQFRMGMMGPHAGMVRQGRASGFIIDPNGTIVTNNHVVKDADHVVVTMSDGAELPAKVVGADPRTDLAVIKVDAGHPLPSLKLGNSNDVEPGQWVIAVGNPFGLGGTVTAGIVSARGRDIGAGPYDAFLQVDAAINQGNSGGPLFTQDGKVVGVNTAILSPSGGSVGIGFAIPSNLVKDITSQLIASGHVTRGYLGVETQNVTAELAPSLGLKNDVKGALVAGVSPDSPAQKAGLQPGDVLRSVDGKAVDNPHKLALMVADIKPGDTAQIGLVRDGQDKTLDVQVGAMKDQLQASNANDNSEQGQQGRIGVALAPLSPEMRDRLNLPDNQKGVVVAGVQQGSPAAAAGLREGDVIVGVGAKAITGPREAVAAIRGATKNGNDVALRVMRDGQARFIAVSPNAQG